MAEQSNLYGLDFLKTEHTLNEHDNDNVLHGGDGSTAADLLPSSWGAATTTAAAAAVVDTLRLAEEASLKSNLEKRYNVIHFLKANRSGGAILPSLIYERTGIDLQDDKELAAMVQDSQSVRVEHVPDPENPSLMLATYAYQSKYPNVKDRKSLLAQINQSKNGVPLDDLLDAYDAVRTDLEALITAGDIIAISNTEDKQKILFPRGEPFLVELDGIVTVPPVVPSSTLGTTTPTVVNGVNGDSHPTTSMNGTTTSTAAAAAMATTSNGENGTSTSTKNSNTVSRLPVFMVDTDSDPRTQIRRGEAVQIGGTWFRVSSAVRGGALKDEPARAQAPLSVTSLVDLSKRNEMDGYIRQFTDKVLPTDAALPPSAIENVEKAKEARERLLKAAHGRSGSAASQLLSSLASAANPTTLAASLGAHTPGVRGRRPNTNNSGGRPTTGAGFLQKQKEDAAAAKKAALDPYLSLYSHAKRNGCTKDVRELYLATRKKVPNNDQDLKNMLVEHKLLEPGEEMRRARMQKRSNGKDNDGKPKKRRYYERKNQRVTNTHLEGTEIGAILARATEKQRQGQQVGDGGM